MSSSFENPLYKEKNLRTSFFSEQRMVFFSAEKFNKLEQQQKPHLSEDNYKMNKEAFNKLKQANTEVTYSHGNLAKSISQLVKRAGINENANKIVSAEILVSIIEGFKKQGGELKNLSDQLLYAGQIKLTNTPDGTYVTFTSMRPSKFAGLTFKVESSLRKKFDQKKDKVVTKAQTQLKMAKAKVKTLKVSPNSKEAQKPNKKDKTKTLKVSKTSKEAQKPTQKEKKETTRNTLSFSQHLNQSTKKLIKANPNGTSFTVQFRDKRGRNLDRKWNENNTRIHHLFQNVPNGTVIQIKKKRGGKVITGIWRKHDRYYPNGTFMELGKLRRLRINNGDVVNWKGTPQQRERARALSPAEQAVAKQRRFARITLPGTPKTTKANALATLARKYFNQNKDYMARRHVDVDSYIRFIQDKNNHLGASLKKGDRIYMVVPPFNKAGLTQKTKLEAKRRKEIADKQRKQHETNTEYLTKKELGTLDIRNFGVEVKSHIADLAKNEVTWNNAWEKQEIHGLRTVKNMLSQKPFNMADHKMQSFLFKLLQNKETVVVGDLLKGAPMDKATMKDYNYYHKMLKSTQKALKADPNNKEYKKNLAYVQQNIADLNKKFNAHRKLLMAINNLAYIQNTPQASFVARAGFDKASSLPSAPSNTKFSQLSKYLSEKGLDRYQVGIDPNLLSKFNKSLAASHAYEDDGFDTGTQYKFKPQDVLKIIFKNYNVKKLIEQGYLKKVGNTDQLVIAKLPPELAAIADYTPPKNLPDFDADIPRYKKAKGLNVMLIQRILNIENGKEIQSAEKTKVMVTGRLKKIFGTSLGAKVDQGIFKQFSLWLAGKDYRNRSLRFEDIPQKKVTEYKNQYLQFTSPRSAFIKMYRFTRKNKLENGKEAFDVKKLVARLNKLMELGYAKLPDNDKDKKAGLPYLSEEQFITNNISKAAIKMIRLGYAVREVGEEMRDSLKVKAELAKRKSDPLYKQLIESGVLDVKKLTLKELQDKWPKTLIDKGTLIIKAGMPEIHYTFGENRKVVVSLPPGIQGKKRVENKRFFASVSYRVGDQASVTLKAKVGIKVNNWDVFASARGRANAIDGVSIGGAIGFERNVKREDLKVRNEALKKLGWDKLLTLGHKQFVAEIRNNPGKYKRLTMMLNAFESNGFKDTAVLKMIFNRYIAPSRLSQASIDHWKGLKFGGAAAVVEAGASPLYGPYARVGAWFKLVIGGKVIVIPNIPPRSKAMLTAKGRAHLDKKLRQTLAQKFPGATIVDKPVSIETSGEVLYDSTGRASVLQKGSEKQATLKTRDKFNEYKKQLAGMHINASLVEKGPMAGMIKLAPLVSPYTDCEFHIDPQMKNSGLLLKDGVPYLSASRLGQLVVSSRIYNYAAPLGGITSKRLITITDNPYRTNQQIMKEEKHFLLKRGNADPDKTTFGLRRGVSYNFHRERGNEGNCLPHYLYKARLKQGRIKQKFKTWEKAKKIDTGAFDRERKGLVIKKSPDQLLKEGRRNKIDNALKKIMANQKLFNQYRAISTFGMRDGVVSYDNVIARKIGKLTGMKLNPSETSYAMMRLASESFVNINRSQRTVRWILKAIMTSNSNIPQSTVNLIGDIMEKQGLDIEKNKDIKKAMQNPKLLTRIANTLKEEAFRGNINCTTKVLGRNLGKLMKEYGIKFNQATLQSYITGKLKTRFLSTDFAKAKGINFNTQQGWAMLSTTYRRSQGKTYEGLRYANLYGLAKNYKLLNMTTMDPSVPGPEGSIAKLMLKMHSDLPSEKFKRDFLKSKLSLKVGTLKHLPQILGGEQAAKVVQMLKNPKLASNPKYAAVYQKFAKIVNKIRQTQLDGGNALFIDGTNYGFYLNTQVKAGVYARCGNPTFAVKEQLTLVTQTQLKKMISAQQTVNVRRGGKRQRRVHVLKIGAMFNIGQKPPEDNKPKSEKPKPANKGKVKETGGDKQGGSSGDVKGQKVQGGGDE